MGVVLARMNQIVLVFQALTHLAKCEVPVTVLAAILRKGRTFIDTFIKSMPFLSKNFLAHSTDILVLLKTFQLSTRTLQVHMSHSHHVLPLIFFKCWNIFDILTFLNYLFIFAVVVDFVCSW